MTKMSTSRYFDRICAVVLTITLLVTVLFMNGQAIGIELIVDADSEAHSDSEYFTENDQLSDWDSTSATLISLEGDSISIRGNNAYEYNGNVVISGSGKYVITGTLDDGCISVNANANSKVWILLNGVDISCSDDACLRVDEADKVFLTLAEGTDNILTGGEELSEEALEDGTYGVIFAHDDLTINGSGSLQIHAGYKHGIKANDDLVITGGTITIDAPVDGIHVNDSFRIKDASLSITAGDDGILTENEDSYFYQESGDIIELEHGEDEWTENIHKQTNRMSKLVGELVALSRLDEAGSVLKKEDFSLTDAAWEIAETVQPQVKAAGKTISIDIRDDLSYTGDRAQIQKMMSVLLDNAVRYGDEKGKIEFSVFREKKLHIRVWNSCHFDSPPDLKRLFDRFYRPDSSRNALTGGTGIGLSLAKAVAEKHGGTITAKCPDADSIVFEVVL